MTDDQTAGGAAPAPDPAAPGTPPSGGAAPIPEGPSLPARLIGTLFSPGLTFRGIVDRPTWIGPLVVYLAAIAAAALVYSFKVDWEALIRGQFEESLAWATLSSIVPEDRLDELERGAVAEILDTGTGGMALQTTAQTVIGGMIVFHVMGIVFATLFYLMGSLGDLKLGRVYLDAFLCLVTLVGYVILGVFLRGIFGEDARGALPYQAGLNAVLLLSYFYMLHQAVERQPAFRKLMSVYAHVMAVPAVASLLTILVMLLSSQSLTIGADQVLHSNLAALTGVKGTGVVPTLLYSLDLFRIWELAAASIGFAALTGLSTGTAISITFLPWGFLAMAKVAVAAAFGS